jgi:sugar O-acyltransferase (sialic acid O-acetyltransferase NeuD family)
MKRSMNEPRVFLVGAGGHGSVLADALRISGVRIAGIVDPAYAPGSALLGTEVLGDDGWLDAQRGSSAMLVNGFGAQPGQQIRERLYAQRRQQGFTFLAVRHPSAVVGDKVSLWEGSQVMAGTVLQCRAVIGENVVVNTRASVDHDCVVGDHAFIGPGAILCGGVQVSDGAFIGAGATLLTGVRIGARAVVGAGSVVVRDVLAGEWVIGNPATRLKMSGV